MRVRQRGTVVVGHRAEHHDAPCRMRGELTPTGAMIIMIAAQHGTRSITRCITRNLHASHSHHYCTPRFICIASYWMTRGSQLLHPSTGTRSALKRILRTTNINSPSRDWIDYRVVVIGADATKPPPTDTLLWVMPWLHAWNKIISKLFHRLIAAHEYFPTCSLSPK